ncbi:hypothetical protein W822_13640 [Advenella kashmirensis W13003]|uniref:Uncharacterized protein n=1 Tax=Advenella kashmirensis W13003 TaxID=1424334 RepID=V8QSQ8_9BURK|nr:hypothetical protein W822_13640 [Advenella kashmirensis W13003]
MWGDNVRGLNLSVTRLCPGSNKSGLRILAINISKIHTLLYLFVFYDYFYK